MLSCVVDRKGHFKQILLPCGGGLAGRRLLTVDRPHWDCHSPRWHILPRSTLLRLLCATGGHCPRLAVYFVPFPGPSHSGDQVLSKHTVQGGLCILCTSLVQAALFPGCTTKTLSQACYVSPQGSWSQTVTLLANVNQPGSQEDMVSDRQPAHSLAGDVVSGANIVAAP